VALFLQRCEWVSLSLSIQLNPRSASSWVDWFTNIYLSLLDYYNLRLQTYIIGKFALYNFLSLALLEQFDIFFYTQKEEEFKVGKEKKQTIGGPSIFLFLNPNCKFPLLIFLEKRDCFHWNCYTPEIHQIEEFRFLGILQYKFKLRFWFHLNLYQVIWFSRCGGFQGVFRGVAFSVESVILSYRVVPGHRNHFFDPASVFSSTHWWSQHPACQRCFYKPLRNYHPSQRVSNPPETLTKEIYVSLNKS